MKTLNTIAVIFEILAYIVTALPFIGLTVAVIYGIARHTLHLF